MNLVMALKPTTKISRLGELERVLKENFNDVVEDAYLDGRPSQ